MWTAASGKMEVMMGNTMKRELQGIYIPKIRSQKYHYSHDKSPITLSRSIGGYVTAQLNSPWIEKSA